MESQIAGQVLGVMGRSSRDGKHQMYDVQFSDGQKYTTFDAGVAQQAQGLVGQAVVMNVRVEQNAGRDGKMYTNYNLDAISTPGALPAPTPSAAPIQVGTAIPAAGVAIPMAAPSSGGGGMSDEDKARVTRLSAAKTGFLFVGSLFAGAGPESLKEAVGMARGLTEGILQYGQTGVWPGGVAATPAGIAAAVPGVAVGVEGVDQNAGSQGAIQATGDDIPWD